MDQPTLTRRDVLKLSAVAATALAVPLTVSLSAKQASELPANRLPKVFARPFATPKVVDLTGGGSQTLYQQMFNAHILDGGLTTRMFGYSTSADPNTATFPGPTILTSQGKSVDITQVNNLPGVHPFLGYEPSTSTHLHGHPSFPEFDGYANDLSHPAGRGLPAQSKTYTYENDTEPRTLWYHDHGVHHTAQNVYMGMAAQYWLTSPEERATPLPKGAFELPLIISDAAFQSNGDLLFDDRSTAGVNGDVILVNGVPWPVLKVFPRTYRFRLLDASIARGYRLRLSTGQPMTVVGTDGGLMTNPQQVTELRVGMAERYELVIDFAKHRGERIELQNLGVPNSVDYDHTDKVMAFDVLDVPDGSFDGTNNGTAFGTLPGLTVRGPVTKQRTLRFERHNGEWTINGHTWEQVEASGFQDIIADPASKAVELWTLENRSGGWFHPIHIHLVDFFVQSRNGRPPAPSELGPKDVVYLGENETVRLIAQFGGESPRDTQGRYMLHCHNADHEDHDMMFQMRVGKDDPNHDPLKSARPTPFRPDDVGRV